MSVSEPFILDKKSRAVCWIALLIGAGLFIYSLQTMMNGPHQMRQAASAFPGYYFCTEETNILYPHIGARGVSTGVAISEFPLYAYTLGQICRLKGGWDEATPRLVSMFFALIAAWLFWRILESKYGVRKNSLLFFVTIFILCPVSWTFFTIPMPESTALMLFGLSGFFWICQPKSWGWQVAGAFTFCLAFLIRPYYILFLFFFLPNRRIVVSVFFACIALFGLWYRTWNGLVTTSPGYFGTQFQTLADILRNLPRALAHFPDRVLEHTAGVGLISLYLSRKKYTWLLLLYGTSIGMMYVLKSTHIAAHAYYLMNAGIFASLLVYLSLPEISDKWRPWFLAGYALFTFSSTWHNFRINPEVAELAKTMAIEGPVPQGAVIASYLGGTDSQWLYFLKNPGFEMNPEDFSGHCPAGATHYLKRDPVDSASPLHFRACPP